VKGDAYVPAGGVLIVPMAEAAVPPGADRLPRLPRDARGRLVLALGEVTGHAHAVVGPGTLFTRPTLPRTSSFRATSAVSSFT
jgi:hypothetical protein